jgi:lysyl-tRNA synthetase class 2
METPAGLGDGEVVGGGRLPPLAAVRPGVFHFASRLAGAGRLTHMEDTNSLIEQRKAKLIALQAKGINPFMNKFTPDRGCDEARSGLKAWFDAKQTDPATTVGLPEGTRVKLAGRISAHRDMGKSQFLDLKDVSGRIQLYAQKQALGDDQFEVFKHLDLADFIGVEGTLFMTRAGEPSLKVEKFTILGKALRPPPAKWEGLADTEIRYRQRYLDLIANDDVKGVFLKRSAIVREIRAFFHERGYVEVETPVMQAIPGGAAAQPFITKHNALGCDFYLRIALELYHKRLLVGGVDRLFEIGKNFRNEGLSRRHNPEFTMLEAYQAFGDYETMMETVESLVKRLVLAVNSGKAENERYLVRHPRKLETDTTLNQCEDLLSEGRVPREFEEKFGGDFNTLRVCFSEFSTTPYAQDERPCSRAGTGFRHLCDLHDLLVLNYIGKFAIVLEEGDPRADFVSRLGALRDKLDELQNERVINLETWARRPYKDLVREKAGADWFDVTPAERRRRAIEDLKLGGDIAAGYEDFEVTGAVFEKLIEPTLINPTFVTHLPKELVPLAKLSPDDPTTVEVFECCINGQEISPGYTEQNDPIAQRDVLEHQAGGEQQKLDEDFLVALEHGMPPAGGIGIGIDRLCMMLLGQESIRDVILFPQLKPKA